MLRAHLDDVNGTGSRLGPSHRPRARATRSNFYFQQLFYLQLQVEVCVVHFEYCTVCVSTKERSFLGR